MSRSVYDPNSSDSPYTVLVRLHAYFCVCFTLLVFVCLFADVPCLLPYSFCFTFSVSIWPLAHFVRFDICYFRPRARCKYAWNQKSIAIQSVLPILVVLLLWISVSEIQSAGSLLRAPSIPVLQEKKPILLLQFDAYFPLYDTTIIFKPHSIGKR